MIPLQEIIRRLNEYWEKQGCLIWQGYDLETGAGTFNPATFLRSLGPEPISFAYVEPSRRPTDGRYGDNPNRTQHYFQYQVLLKPAPENIQEMYLKSLKAIGFDLKNHDIRFVHDDWESPTLGAWGLGWEVWMDGMEITQFTYFQALAGHDLHPISGEITYGLERIALYLQKVDDFFSIPWNDTISYGELFHENEVEWSRYNFEEADISYWRNQFDGCEKEAFRLIQKNLPLPAYDFVIKASHAFNLLDARGVISVTERTGYITRIRDLSKKVADEYVEMRKQKGFPLLKKTSSKKSTLKRKEIDAPQRNEDFILEIGSEELPASFVPIGMRNLEKGIKALLGKENLIFESLQVYGTPRRLSIFIRNLAFKKPSTKEEKKGPSVLHAFDENGNPKQAGIGFFHSLSMTPVTKQEIEKGQANGISIRTLQNADYLFAEIKKEERNTTSILSEALPSLIANIDFPKKMRWDESGALYARPIRWLLSLFGNTLISFQYGDVESDRFSFGHRQRDPQKISLDHASEYLNLLEKHYVLVDPKKRKEKIESSLKKIEEEQNAVVLAKEEVLKQVVHLVEWPDLIVEKFSSSFLDLPKEVLISEMVEHQKYFPLGEREGKIKNSFIITADNIPTSQIGEGNVRVLSSRLSDGSFLFKQDSLHPLEFFTEKLKNMTFQKSLGTVFEKVHRVMAHAELLQDILGTSTPSLVQRAAYLAKADLATQMVYEFPELQGTMGKYYALLQNEDREVATAIEEHWMPKGENSPLPATETGTLLSLADKFDHILSCFRADLKPTSSNDPYGLRRQALGIIHILIEKKIHLPFLNFLRRSLDHFTSSWNGDEDTLLKEIEQFFIQRLKTVFQEKGIGKEDIEASISLGLSDIYDMFLRVQALEKFRKEESSFFEIYEVYKRAKRQLALGSPASFSEEILEEKAEKNLHAALLDLQPRYEKFLREQQYLEAYQSIASLRQPLSNLFDEVKILDQNLSLQGNRLALLSRVVLLFEQLLDFSKIKEKI